MPVHSTATITQRTPVTDHLLVLRIRPDQPQPFTPGQFLSLGLEDGGRLLHRAYSIASIPSDSELEFFIERVPNGQFTPKLWECQVGDTLLLPGRPAGVFTLNEPKGIEQHLFVSTVTGAVPFISILRQEKADRDQGKPGNRRYLLLHGASQAEEFGPYYEELTDLASRDWFTYVPTVSRVWDNAAWAREIGRVEDILRKYSDYHGFVKNRAEAYVCGHPGMVENAEAILKRAGFHHHHISTEIYFKAARTTA